MYSHRTKVNQRILGWVELDMNSKTCGFLLMQIANQQSNIYTSWYKLRYCNERMIIIGTLEILIRNDLKRKSIT